MERDWDAAFWRHIDRIETDFTADCDDVRFRRRMRRKGFEEEVIEERLRALNDERANLFSRLA